MGIIGYLLDTLHIVQPRRVLLWDDGLPPLVIASDRRQDEKSPPSIVAVLYDPSTGQKAAVAAIIPPQFLKEWDGSEHCIALIEQAALILGVLRFKILCVAALCCGLKTTQLCCQAL